MIELTAASQSWPIAGSFRISRGAKTAADVVVEGTYEVPYQEHAFLQPEAGVGYVDEDELIHRDNLVLV